MSADSELLLEVEHLTVDFPTDDGVVHATRDISYTLSRGDVLGVVGESGSGKSVSSLAVMGLLPPTARVSGSAKFCGQELLGSHGAVKSLRGNKLAMIFQDPMTALNPVYTVGVQLREALRVHNREMPKREMTERSIDALELVGIPNPKDGLDSFPHEFSGGMRQRAMIAMAMINDPDILIADEPTTALDVTVQAQILETLERVQARTGAAIILITHDLGVIAGMAQRVLVMYGGAVVESGSVDDIFYRTSMPYTAGLLGSMPGIHAHGSRLRPIPGSPPSLIRMPPGCSFGPRCPMVTDACRLDAPGKFSLVGTQTHASACIRRDEVLAMDDARTMFAATHDTEVVRD